MSVTKITSSPAVDEKEPIIWHWDK